MSFLLGFVRSRAETEKDDYKPPQNMFSEIRARDVLQFPVCSVLEWKPYLISKEGFSEGFLQKLIDSGFRV